MTLLGSLAVRKGKQHQEANRKSQKVLQGSAILNQILCDHQALSFNLPIFEANWIKRKFQNASLPTAKSLNTSSCILCT